MAEVERIMEFFIDGVADRGSGTVQSSVVSSSARIW